MKPIWIIAMMQMGVSAFADSAPGPIAQTPMQVYHCYVYDTLAPRWYAEMEKNKTGLTYSEVKIQLTFHVDGTVSSPKILVGESAGLLKAATLKVIFDTAPFKPFSDALVKEMGPSYVDNFTFEITRPKTSLSLTPAEARQRVAPVPAD